MRRKQIQRQTLPADQRIEIHQIPGAQSPGARKSVSLREDGQLFVEVKMRRECEFFLV